MVAEIKRAKNNKLKNKASFQTRTRFLKRESIETDLLCATSAVKILIEK